MGGYLLPRLARRLFLPTGTHGNPVDRCPN